MLKGLNSVLSTLLIVYTKVLIFSAFIQFKCVQAVLKGVPLDEAPLYQPMPDQILNDRQ